MDKTASGVAQHGPGKTAPGSHIGRSGHRQDEVGGRVVELGRAPGHPHRQRPLFYASSARLAFAPVSAWLRSDRLQSTLPALEPVWLTEIARLLPELLADESDIAPPGPLNEAWQRQRLFEALSRPFFEQRQLVLLLDDIQWCDHETLEWLAYLLQAQTAARRSTDRPARLLVVAALRVEEISDDERFASLLRDLRRGDQLTEVELGPLTREQVGLLGASLSDQDMDVAPAADLYRETEGNPLFVVETVRAGLATAGREKDGVQSHWALPPTVQEAIARRLARLSPQALDLAGLAATIGREFTFEVLVQASGGDEESLVRGLDELWQRRVVRELGADAYDFRHDKIREVAYAGLSAARRRLLHRRVAEALETLHTNNLGLVSGQIGAHYQQAGQSVRAIHYYHRAAEAARRIYANQEAVAHLEQALTMLDSLPAADNPLDTCDEFKADLYEGLGDVLALVGQLAEARNAFMGSLSLILGRDWMRQARLQRRIADTWRSQQMYDKAEAAYDKALRPLGPDPSPSDSARWQTWLDIQMERVNLLYYQMRLAELNELCQVMQQPVTDFGTAVQKADFYSALDMLRLRQERYVPSKRTLSYAEAALYWALQANDPILVNHKTFGLGFCLLWSGDVEGAIAQMMSALSRAEQMGHVVVATQCLAYLGVAHRVNGDATRAETYTVRSLKGATALQNPFYIGVAEANLSWLAYRGGECGDAVEFGKTALSRWQGFAYPFHWLAHWPLLAIASTKNDIQAVLTAARGMLDDVQQQMPDAVSSELAAGVRLWEQANSAQANSHLKQALRLAQETGYL